MKQFETINQINGSTKPVSFHGCSASAPQTRRNSNSHAMVNESRSEKRNGSANNVQGSTLDLEIQLDVSVMQQMLKLSLHLIWIFISPAMLLYFLSKHCFLVLHTFCVFVFLSVLALLVAILIGASLSTHTLHSIQSVSQQLRPRQGLRRCGDSHGIAMF